MAFRSRVRLLTLFLGLMILRPATTAEINWKDPPQGVFEDRWYVILVNGQRAGYSRVATKRNDQTIESLNFIELGIARGAAEIKLVMKSVQKETLRGEPLGFDVEQQMSLATVMKKGVVRDGRVYITSTEQGRSTENNYEWDPKSKMAWGIALATRTEPIAVGKVFDLWTYDALVRPSGPVRTQLKIVGKETIDMLGRQVEAFKAEATTYLMAPITTISYVDESGADLRMTMDMGFIKADLIACSKEYALQKAASPELFIQTVIEMGKPLNPERLKRIRYRLNVSDTFSEEMFPTTGMQRVIRREDQMVELEVCRIDWNKLKQATSQPVPADIKPYLEASAFLDAKNPKIIEQARKAVGAEKDPVRMADLLRRHVSSFIDKKDLTVGLATASEVVQTRQGDCTEHAVLLAAMARAVGIPARCVGGIVYVSAMTGKKYVFGFHMWTQVWLAGQWVDIDGALLQTDCDPSHIVMTIMPLNEDGMADIAVGILPFIGKTRIEVLETEKN